LKSLRIVVTGGDGFIARNLRVRLQELHYDDVVSVDVGTSEVDRQTALANADFVFHLAGVNRPNETSEFDSGNRGFTRALCEELRTSGRAVPIAYTSSTQALLDNPYGVSKRAGELEVERYAAETGASVHVLRLANVFGKWCRPNYNSAVATFCYNISHGIPITVNDESAPLRLVYVEDVVEVLVGLLERPGVHGTEVEVHPVYATTVGQVVTMLRGFAEGRRTHFVGYVGNGFARVLYSTYVSYLTPDAFSYALIQHADARGVFAEFLKTADCGQFSYFTALPGVTRGGHYHHTKSEKFFVVKGCARFGFRHVVTGETHEILVSGEEGRVVETVPGWAHNVTNVGDDEMIVMLWANELFDPQHPDTVATRVLD
jgi:UDP-2-acetamido-2,6-beta-L-arabino-hexul-4-ose reductase